MMVLLLTAKGNFSFTYYRITGFVNISLRHKKLGEKNGCNDYCNSRL